MTSLLNQSGLNFQNGNPLGRKVRALEADVDTLKKEIQALKAGGATTSGTAGTTTTAATATVSPSFIADMDALKRDMAMIKLAGFGKGEKGDRGDKGEKGDRGETGPMTYIAMPANATLPVATAVA
jgi:hypothetical protein